MITSINGQIIKSNSELRNAVGLSRVGEKLDVALIRDRKPLHLTAVITELPQTTGSAGSKSGSGGSAENASIHPGLAGATLADAPDQAAVTLAKEGVGLGGGGGGLPKHALEVGIAFAGGAGAVLGAGLDGPG